MNYRKGLILAALLAIMNAPLSAHAYSDMFVFGDSLSDAGNLNSFLGLPIAPYVDGYLSNGPVWVQTLATRLGLPDTTPSFLGGNNYAWAGARTGGAGFPDALTAQRDTYLTDSGGSANADALYVIWGGGNNVRAGDSTGPTDISDIISSLALAGATDFLVPNLPDIGLTPESMTGGPPGTCDGLSTPQCMDLLSGVTADHNAALQAEIDALSAADPDLNIVLFDVFSIFNLLINDPFYLASFGFTNVDTACYDGLLGTGGPGNICANPDEFVFWDGIHPTAAAHELLGTIAARQLGEVVPVPAALPLMLSALGIFGFMRRRRAA